MPDFQPDDMGSIPITRSICSFGQVVKTADFLSAITGSIPVGSTNFYGSVSSRWTVNPLSVIKMRSGCCCEVQFLALPQIGAIV